MKAATGHCSGGSSWKNRSNQLTRVLQPPERMTAEGSLMGDVTGDSDGTGGQASGDGTVRELSAQILEAGKIIAELRERDSLKTQFLSNIAHDLRTPLTAIITHA